MACGTSRAVTPLGIVTSTSYEFEKSRDGTMTDSSNPCLSGFSTSVAPRTADEYVAVSFETLAGTDDASGWESEKVPASDVTCAAGALASSANETSTSPDRG